MMKSVNVIVFCLFFQLCFAQQFPENYEPLKKQMYENLDEDWKAEIRHLIQEQPSDPWLYWMMGVAQNLQFHTDSAIYYFEQSIQVDPTFARGYHILGSFYTNMDDENCKKAIDLFSKAIQFDSLNGYYFSDRGAMYFKLKQYDLALSDCKKAITCDEYLSPGPFVIIVKSLLQQNKREELNAFIQQRVFIGSNGFWDTDFDFLMGNLYEENGDPNMACECYTHAIYMLEVMEEAIPPTLLEKRKKCPN